jgi:hypothetical protein
MDDVRFTYGQYEGDRVIDVCKNNYSYIINCFLTERDVESKYKNQYECVVNYQNQLKMLNNNLNPKITSGKIINDKIIEKELKIPLRNNIIPNNTEFKHSYRTNFAEDIILSAMMKLGIPEDYYNPLICEIKNDTHNINDIILDKTKDYLNNYQVNRNENFIKISLAWRYGICSYDNKPFSKSLVDNISTDIFDNNKTIDEIISKLTEKVETSEKITLLNNGIPLSRKICKSLPFLFTPALFQFYLLGLTNKEIKGIYKCRFDDVMGYSNRLLPNNIEELSPFYNFDWEKDYYSFLLNPYAYYTINLSTCDKVIELTGRSVDDFKHARYLGSISRKIYESVKTFKSTCTPSYFIENHIVDNEMKDILELDYGIIFDMECYYLKHIYRQEVEVSNFISKKLRTEDYEYKITRIYNDKLSNEQYEAVKISLSQPITVINSSAGTGKTTIIKEIISQLDRNTKTFNKFVVCAFTAKAVKRVQEVLGNHEIIMNKNKELVSCVRTIHSLMNAIENKTIEFPKYIIIDEASMISLDLFYQLLKMLRNHDFNLIMLGDINQLPPIKYGRPFEDIINSRCVSAPILSKNYRVIGHEDDPIIVNSNNIIKENYDFMGANNFHLLNTNNYNFRKTIKNILSNISISDTKFITNTNDNNTRLNKAISEFIGNKNKKYISCFVKDKDKNVQIEVSMSYAVGDPVIFTKNNVYPGTLNGDEGIIYDFIENESKEYMLILLNDKSTSIPMSSEDKKKNLIKVIMHPCGHNYIVKNVLLAYSITVHKSQGSEYKNVYFYIDGNPGPMFNNKRLTYTAITRAKENCTIIEGNPNLFINCCRESIIGCRSNLKKRIISYNNNS